MKRSIAAMLGICLIAIVAVATPAARADDTPQGGIDNQGNRISLTTGSLTAVFEGMVPKVTFYDHSGMIHTQQKVNFRALIEFADTDNNGIFESNEKVAALIIDEAAWDHTYFYTLPGGKGVGINFTLSGTPNIVSPSDGHTMATLQPRSVIIIVKAYNATEPLTINGKTFTVGKAEVKFDIIIANWPFQNTTDMLALQVNMHSESEHFDNQGQDIDSTHDESSQTSEHSLGQTNDVDQVKFSSGLVTTSSTIGFFRFVSTATVTNGAQTTNVKVAASYKSETENDGGDRETFMKLYLAYPNFQGTLVHDPSIGLGSGIPTLYLIAGGAAVAGLITVLVIRRKHLRVQKGSVHN
jgi:hypothetical protein